MTSSASPARLRPGQTGSDRQTRDRGSLGRNTASMCCNSLNSSGRSGSSSTPATAWPGRWSRRFSTACPIWRSSRCSLRSPAASCTSPIRWWNQNLDMLKQQDRAGQSRTWASALTATPIAACSWMRTARRSAAISITALLARDFLQKPREQGRDDRLRSALQPRGCRRGESRRRRAAARRVGHAFIKKTMAETKAVFGGELSGHFYFRDNFFADSGAIAFARAAVGSVRPVQAAQRTDRPAAPLQPERRNQFPGRGQGRQNPRAGRRLQEKARSIISTASPSIWATGGSTSARATPSRCCV